MCPTDLRSSWSSVSDAEELNLHYLIQKSKVYRRRTVYVFFVWHGPQFRQNEMGSCRVRRCHVTIREEVWKYGENYPKYFLSKEATKTSLLDWTTCPQFFLLSNKLWDYNKLVTEFDWNWIPWGIFQLYFRFNEQPLRHFLTSVLQFWYGLINVADSKYDFFC